MQSMQSLSYFESPTTRGRVLVPGVPVLPADMERHPVPGGGSRLLELDAGDELTVVDREGLQACEIVVFGEDGRADSGLAGSAPSGDGAALRAALAAGTAASARLRTALASAGVDLASTPSILVFGEGSRAGDRARFTLSAPAKVWVGAPGEAMRVNGDRPPTEILAYVRRTRRRNAKPDVGPPDPLADALQDINIQPGNARAYEVKAGQYIQLVDVKGRECTDFQAFSLRALDQGLEREIEPTTTRTIMGNAFPMPGLHSKYFTVDQEPLVEVIQDTCGQHDTFGLACTARYYEDMGYPGHVNCSDNMSAAAEPFGIRPRAGWPAVNFFFNTAVDDSHAIQSDEPWSRPGDYVLMRALTDLLCLSTACPSDIGPANAWNPTDIQVRVYGENADFERATAVRPTADADARFTHETAFGERLRRHTRDFVDANGYWMVNTVTGSGTIEEYWACRERAAVMDLSGLRKFEVTGPEACALLQLCMTRNIEKLAVGQVVYTAMCYPHGGMIDDGTVFRMEEGRYRWVGGCDASGIWLREQAQSHGLDAWIKSSTEQIANLALQGPKSREILDAVAWTAPGQTSVPELGWFRFTVARVGGAHGVPVVVSRTGFTGELGYEIFCHPDDAAALFDAVWDAGRPHGLALLGLGALDLLRVEAGLVIAGQEFTDQTDPFEAGIGFTVPLKSKPSDFVGREALVRRKASPLRRLVGLALSGNEVPAHGDCVYAGRPQIGEVTSAVRSPVLGKVIALARVDVAHAETGTALEVGKLDGHQKRIPAIVVPFPHFDPEKRRVRGDYGSGRG